MTAVAILVTRPAADADAKEVIDLLVEADLEVAFDPREFVVATDGERVVACARMKPLDGGAHEIASVAVRADLRGRGVGERVVRAALERATGTVYALALAPGFFRKQGFEPLPETPAALAAKASGVCSSKGFVAMAWHASPDAAVADIRRRYAQVALARGDTCCGAGDGSCCTSADYAPEELAALPEGAHLNLGTGNPVRAADLRPGEVVLDLGSGAGVDVFLAARAVGPAGRAIGVDFTPEMIERARENARSGGFANVAFHEAPIERLPLPDASVDVVTSNCVVNLSVDKPAVLREALRVLKPGGRLVASDTLRLPWTPTSATPSCDCTTGAMSASEWKRALADAGFADVALQASDGGASVGRVLVRARKPA